MASIMGSIAFGFFEDFKHADTLLSMSMPTH